MLYYPRMRVNLQQHFMIHLKRGFMKISFIGRKDEIEQLRNQQDRGRASLVVVQGRRRIGKSRLIEEFAKGQTFYRFTGLAPTKEITSQMQRDEFTRQFGAQFGLTGIRMTDWGDIFSLLAKHTAKGKLIILFDEISWMGSEDPTFLAKLKTAWDEQFHNNPKLMLILCGSVSSWIEKNIISSTDFLGRPHCYLRVEELPLHHCNEFWGEHRARISAYEKFKVLALTGGVPRYLELINPTWSAEQNIKQMCFTKHSPLLNEFERIFSDIFGDKSDLYKTIITLLLNGTASQEEILTQLSRTKSGDLSEYLNDLKLAGFIARDFTWHLKTSDASKLSHYRLKDNYIRFYLKYIAPHKVQIEKNMFSTKSPSTLPGWETMLGLQFENLVLNNELRIAQLLNIPLEDIIFSNPFFQRKTQKQEGCQIDLMIQTKFNTLYICEIKFKKNSINSSVIKEVEQKIQRIKLPRHFSYRPVLIHASDVEPEVLDSGYFNSIIDFGQLLEL
jgi:uncharacterized protein